MSRPLAFALLLALAACGADEKKDPPADEGCAAGLLDCGGACVSIAADPAHCGACGVACGAGEVCAAGRCARTCASQRFLGDQAITLAPGSYLSAATAADADGDGLAELVVADRGSRLLVLRQEARGEFAAPASIDEAVMPMAVAAGDLDGDGRADLVVRELQEERTLVLRNDGAGSFAKHWIARTAAPTAFALGDVDGDGLLDVVAAAADAEEVAVLRGTGDGKLEAWDRFQFSAGPFAPAIADLDGDGRPEVIVATDGNHVVSAMYRRDAGFEHVSVVALGTVGSVAAGDLDGDGIGDLAVAGRTGAGLDVHLGRADGTLERLPLFDGLPGGARLLAGDVDGDGRAEVVAAGAGTLTVLGVRDGAVVQESSGPGPSARPDALVDLDGDGALDLVLTSPGQMSFAGQVHAVYAVCD